MSAVRVTGFDHLVLTVADVERSLAFYCGTLGLEPVRVDRWRAGEAPFPSVRIDPGRSSTWSGVRGVGPTSTTSAWWWPRSTGPR
ncbi:VOC family protein [Micromonospora rubida]|uniref:VOC family protein n=1 Tax=Micromonospora rubida TaxID=2697657 RepID=A0ABW7SE11_9ACTN